MPGAKTRRGEHIGLTGNHHQVAGANVEQVVTVLESVCNLEHALSARHRETMASAHVDDMHVRIPVSGLTAATRRKAAQALGVKAARRRWGFVRYEERGFGRSYVYYLVPPRLVSPRWVVIGGLVMAGGWLTLCATIPGLMVLANLLQLGLLATLLVARKQRAFLFAGYSRRLVLGLVTAGIVLGFVGCNTALFSLDPIENTQVAAKAPAKVLPTKANVLQPQMASAAASATTEKVQEAEKAEEALPPLPPTAEQDGFEAWANAKIAAAQSASKDLPAVFAILNEIQAGAKRHTPRDAADKKDTEFWKQKSRELKGKVARKLIQAGRTVTWVGTNIPYFPDATLALDKETTFHLEEGTLKVLSIDPPHFRLEVVALPGEEPGLIEEMVQRSIVDGIFQVFIHTEAQAIRITSTAVRFDPRHPKRKGRKLRKQTRSVAVRRDQALKIAQQMLAVESFFDLVNVREGRSLDSPAMERGMYNDRSPGLSLMFEALKKGRPLRDKKKERLERLLVTCGQKPTLDTRDAPCGLERAIGETANDPDSIDVQGCSAPRLTEDCWKTTCRFRQKNVLGALVADRAEFSLKNLAPCLLVIVRMRR